VPKCIKYFQYDGDDDNYDHDGDKNNSNRHVTGSCCESVNFLSNFLPYLNTGGKYGRDFIAIFCSV